MNKILIGVVVALLVAVAGLWWSLHGAQDDRADALSLRDAAKQEASQSQQALHEQQGATTSLLGRLASLEAATLGMRAEQQANNQRLEKRLANLPKLTKTQGDSDESFSCLDTPVPAALDGWLRDEPTNGADGH